MILTRIAVLVLALALAAASPSAFAQSTYAPGPHEAKLDKLLAGRDFEGLTKVVLEDGRDEEAVVRTLDWLQAKQLGDGGSAYVALLYAALLWQVAQGLPEPQKASLAQSAGFELILARWLVQAEGFQCADTSAPGARLDMIDSQFKDIARYVTASSAADRRKMTDIALAILLGTFKRRANDVWLCSGGIAQFNKYFEKYPGATGKETTVPGGAGKTITLPADPSIVPDFVAFLDWKARRRAAIDRIAKEAGAKPPADYQDAATRMK
jgi:hypothetical protein